MRNRMANMVMAALAVVLLAACAQAERKSGSVYLIRHAEKAPTPEGDPDLSPAGFVRATCWARYFSTRGINRVYASRTRRAWQTAEPVAASLDVPIVPYDPFALEELAGRLTDGPTALVVGHSNTTPLLAAQLGADPGEPIEESEYGRVYRVTDGKGVIAYRVCDSEDGRR